MESIKKFSNEAFSSLKIPNYRLYFFGQAISLCGTWMQAIAEDWLVLDMTHSGTQLGLVTAAQYLPVLLLAPVGGLIVDRFNKRRLVFFTQISFGVLALILGLLVLTATIKLWMVYVLAIGFGLVTAVDSPTRQTFVLEMVGKEDLPNAIALNASQFNTARVVGPAIAGWLIATLGIATCFLINAASYIAILAMLFRLDKTALKPEPPAESKKGQLTEGFKYIKSTPALLDVLIIMAIVGTLSYETSVSLPLLTQFTFHGSAAIYAALTSAMGVGAILGGVFFASRNKPSRTGMSKAAALFGISFLLLALAPNLPLSLLALVLVGACSINLSSLGNVTLQMSSSGEMRGRVMAMWAVVILGSTPIGGPIIGWIGQHAGPRWSIAVGGFAALAAAGLGYWRLNRYPKH